MGEGGAARVLVAVGDEGVRSYIAVALAQAGYQALEVGDGETALAALDGGSFDLVVVSGRLPLRDGPELLGLMAGRPAWQAVPVILLSASPHAPSTPVPGRMSVSSLGTPFGPERLLRLAGRLLAEAGGRPASVLAAGTQGAGREPSDRGRRRPG